MTKSYRNSDPTPPIMQGIPVPAEMRIPPHDWDAPPWNRWAFANMREVVRTVDVPRGDSVWEMPGKSQDVDHVAFDDAFGKPTTWGAFLNESYTDATLVWVDGKIVTESYFNAMRLRTPHIVFSVSKSIASAVCGSLIDEGLMDPAYPVTDLIPELASTAWNGATLQQVLDMTTGVTFDETYGDPASEVFMLDVAGDLKPLYPFQDPATTPRTTWDLIMQLTGKEAEHGARFSYRSIETDLLGYLMERASDQRFATLVSERLWAPMGAEHDGFYTVDRAGYPLADGGFCCALRDLARFGRLMLEDGKRDGRQIVPKAWIEDIRSGDHGLFDDDHKPAFPNGRYRNQFWIVDRDRPEQMCLGIFGQHVLVDPEAGVMAAKLSSWPTALSDEGYGITWRNGVRAVAREFGART